MVQIAGSGFGNAVNYAIVDNSAGGNSGRLWVNAEISGGIHIGSISANVDSIYIQSGNNILGSMYIIGSANVYGDLTAVTGSEVYVKAGSVIITNSITASSTNSIFDLGSVGQILSGTDTSFITHSISSGSIYRLTAIDLTSTSDTLFSLYHNGSLITKFRNNTAEQNILRSYPSAIQFTTGSVVVKGVHGETLSQGFIGAIYGFE